MPPSGKGAGFVWEGAYKGEEKKGDVAFESGRDKDPAEHRIPCF